MKNFLYICDTLLLVAIIRLEFYKGSFDKYIKNAIIGWGIALFLLTLFMALTSLLFMAKVKDKNLANVARTLAKERTFWQTVLFKFNRTQDWAIILLAIVCGRWCIGSLYLLNMGVSGLLRSSAQVYTESALPPVQKPRVPRLFDV